MLTNLPGLAAIIVEGSVAVAVPTVLDTRAASSDPRLVVGKVTDAHITKDARITAALTVKRRENNASSHARNRIRTPGSTSITTRRDPNTTTRLR